MKLKIALSGAAGCGKTTLMKGLQDSKYLQALSAEEPIEFLPEVVRTLKAQYGFRINEHGTFDTEMMVMSAHLQNVIARPRFVTDRCLVDNMIYSVIGNTPIPQWYSEWNKSLVDHMVGYYDIIFFIPNEFQPPEDGVRNLDPEYWNLSKARFIETYNHLQTLHPTKIMRIGGSISDRIQKMEAAIRFIVDEKKSMEPKE